MDFSDEMVDEIYKIFQVESEEIISKINNNLLTLEKNPNDKEAILMLFRDAHSLKGASRMIGFNDVQTIAHKMEDVLGLAKEDKISLNSRVVDILYKAVDFLFELIQKSLQKKQQVYSENTAKHISALDNINNLTEDTLPKVEQKDIDRGIFAENIDKINPMIINSLVLLMELETKKEQNDLIKKLFDTSSNLQNIFEKLGSYELKKMAEDINFKLNFIIKTSSSLTQNEIKEIHQTVDNIIKKIEATCDAENISVIDYYSSVFDYVPEPENESQNIVKEIIPDVAKDKSQVPKITISNKPTLDLIKNKFFALLQNLGSIAELKEDIQASSENYDNNNVKNILQKIIEILDFALENGIKLNEEIVSVIAQSIDYCEDLTNPQGEIEDNELMFQRLEVVQQILELDKQKSEPEIPVNPKIDQTKKEVQFSDVFNTGEIKTLRVDSKKLDELINQVNELTIEKIKLKKHLYELANINREVEDWQRSLVKGVNYLKYYDKKYIQQTGSESSNLFLSKQFLNLFEDNNQKAQKISSSIVNLHRTIQEDDNKMEVTVSSLGEMVKNIRILPFSTVFHLFGRMVRDIAQEKNKKINFEIIGSETTTDKKIIEEIKAPLIHMIRNAIDHGIETPEERIKLGKPAEGNIILSAYQHGNKVILEIKDDGKGINLAKIKEKAISKGFLTQDELKSMNDDQITNLIFAPGFSTGDEVTSISGRGIGLDVVQTKISQLNGKVRVFSEFNKGCCVQIELPMTMSILRVFLVKAHNQIFAIPMDVINFVLRKNNDELIYKNGKNFIVFEEETVDLYNLSEILNLTKKPIETSPKTILLLEAEGKKIALCVDELIGEQEVLQKKLAPPFYKLKNVSGLTTLISGEICMILNMSNIFNWTKTHKSSSNLIANTSIDNKFFNILLVDDSSTTITLEKTILKKAGYTIETAEHPLEALDKMKNTKFDLIITDVEMPNMNGFEFLEKIKTDEMYCDIPVVMMSSLSSDETRQKAFKTGAKEYIIKGEFNQQSLQKVVDDILHKT